MIRFKVVRASHLLLAVAIALLLAVLVLIGIRVFSQGQAKPPKSAANLVDATNGVEAKTTLVFASADDAPRNEATGIDIEVIRPAEHEAEPVKVLIYHTHTHEAYEQMSEDPYEAVETWRTKDAGHSVVRVGRALAEQLRQMDFEVVHDTTDHEGDALSTAYTRSLATLMSYTEPFDLYIDLHRDAYVEGEALTVAAENGEALAPLMLLIGNGKGFEEKPWFEENYAFACALRERVNREAEGLCKPVLVKDGRYNQHIGVFAVLIEVGHNRNTLSQALDSVPPLARALYSLMIEDPDPVIEQMKRSWKEKVASR